MCVRYIDFASVFASVRLDYEQFRQCGIFFWGGGGFYLVRSKFKIRPMAIVSLKAK